MSIQKKSSRLGKGNALTKHQRRAAKLRLRCKMPPWNSNLLRPIGATASKISCTKVHISPWEKIIFWELGKHRCSHILRITYCRKSDNWSCSVLKKKEQLKKKNTFYEEYLPTPMAAPSTVISGRSDHFWRFLALHTKHIVGSW